MIRKVMTMLMIGGLVVSTAACNTVRGAGEDLSSAADCGEDVLDGDDC